MGYYTRVLGLKDPDINIKELLDYITARGLTAGFEYVDGESAEKWTILDVRNIDGEPLAQIERNPVVEGELGMDELEEFREQVQDCEPASAVKWLNAYFEKVKVIYAFQILHAGLEDKNLDIINATREKIWERTGGIGQADDEGFSNEEGYQILWQFNDDVTGEWHCAVRNLFGQWQKFIMNLGDPGQREEFKSGKVPKKAQRL